MHAVDWQLCRIWFIVVIKRSIWISKRKYQFTDNMDYIFYEVWMELLSIPKLQRFNHWSLGG